LNGAPPAAALPPARLTDLHTSPAGSLGKQCASRDCGYNGFFVVFNREGDFVIGHFLFHPSPIGGRVGAFFAVSRPGEG